MSTNNPDTKHLPFVKLVTSGVSYIAIDGRYPIDLDAVKFAVAVCNPRYGIGADYLLMLEMSATEDFKLSCFAPDGSLVTPAGGARVAAKFLHLLDVLNAEERALTFETKSKNMHVEIIGQADKVRMDMGSPSFDACIAGEAPLTQNQIPKLQLEGISDPVIPVTFSELHCVVFTSGVDYLDITELAVNIESSDAFGARVHIEFAEIVDPERIKMRIWAPGKGEVLAHDEAIAAVMAAAIRCRKVASTVHVKTLEDEFELHWNRERDRIYLVGFTQVCFRGVVDVESLIACTERTKLN
jgi:diaminopimelate epimerase